MIDHEAMLRIVQEAEAFVRSHPRDVAGIRAWLNEPKRGRKAAFDAIWKNTAAAERFTPPGVEVAKVDPRVPILWELSTGLQEMLKQSRRDARMLVGHS